MPIMPFKPASSGSATTSLPWSSITSKPNFAAVSTTGSYSDLSGKPTTVSAAGLTDAATMPWCMSNFLTASALSPYATTTSLSSYATVSSLTGYATTSAIATKFNTPTGTTAQYIRGDGTLATFPGLFDGTYSSLTGKPTLATVATSGSYVDLINKPAITSVLIGTPVSKSTLSLSTAYQATDPTKPTLVTLSLTSTSSISLSGTSNNEGAIWIGATNAVASGTGTRLAEYKNTLGGALVVGLTITTSQTQPYSFILPIGWYYAVRQLTGSGMSVVSVFDQSLT